MTDGHIVIAAQIDWTGGLVQVTDSTLRIDAALLIDGQFEPRILGGVSWGEAARHPYQSQAGELSIGNLTLANVDGGLDALASGDVVGAEVELRRGSDADRWASLEFVFVARVSGVRLNGRSEIVLELENVLADLAGPVFSDKFDSSVPNPQLEGKDIPLVIGRVKQAPVLEFNPTQLEYYTATNVSRIGNVSEGANPTQKWAVENLPTFELKGSPSLLITADFEGPDATGVGSTDLLSGTGDFADWTAGEPDGWTVTINNDGGGNIATITEVVDGIQVTLGEGSGVTKTTNSSTGANARSTPNSAFNRAVWINPQNAIGSGFAVLLTTTSTFSDSLEIDFTEPNALEFQYYFISGDADFFNNFVGLQLTENGAAIKNIDMIGNSALNRYESQYISDIGLKDTYGLRVSVKSGVTAAMDIGFINVYSFGPESPTVELRTATSVNVNEPYLIEIEYTPGDPIGVCFGFVDDGAYRGRSFRAGQVVKLDESGIYRQVVFPNTSNSDFFLRFAEGLGDGFGFGSATIKNVRVYSQPEAAKKYPELVEYLLVTAGIPLTARDSASISAHATAAGDPDLGWLVRGDETVDQILFRLAGSLGGYVWHGLDGKVRSKRLALPTDPGGTPFVIDSSRADIDEISAFDDPAPQLTTRVNALRNWQPIDPDRQAGITSTWTEADRAAAAADWRITRVYAADANYKRRWAAVESREPYSSALIDATAAQTLADQAGLWANRPRFYEIPTEVLIGELADVAVGTVVRVELDYPGLDGVWMLVLGREGDARPGTVNLTLWG